ncbi:MAG: ABC transporter substrate-binding protein [Pseudomonadota bacterium]
MDRHFLLRSSIRAAGCFLALFLCQTGPSRGDTDAPLTLDHRWGETRFAPAPERPVTLSYIGLDIFLALDLVPIAYRVWFGGDENGLWPWTKAALPADKRPIALRGEIDVERVARFRPDMVEAMFSGISRAQFAALSHVVPVLPPLKGDGDFGITWKEMLVAVGQATARQAKARKVIDGISTRIDAVRNAHPGWAGRTVVIALPDGPVLFGENDPRVALLSELGFTLPDAARALSRGNFYFKLDKELTAPLEADVVIWLDFGGGMAGLKDHPLRHTMRIVREGREIFADPVMSAALSYGSPLSIPYVLEQLAPRLEQALDGDPATRVSGF